MTDVARSSPAEDPVTSEVYRHLFAAVAEEMGLLLRRTACSPNIKERRDYSCAVFDAEGRLVSQGDNIPVHLGSMPASVAAALEDVKPGEGDVVILNDPYRGGTHLPDITMVAGCFVPGNERAAFYLANRAHHADVGGSSPGSMPLARELIQEGLILPPVLWKRGGVPEDGVRRLLLANVRTPAEREGDLAAQEASLDLGRRRLAELMARRGRSEVEAYARHLQVRAERSMRALLASIPDGVYRFEDVLDGDGMGAESLPICVAITIRGDHASVDFAGTAPASAGGINAVPAIVRSAVDYAFRCLLPPHVPASSGLAAPISVAIPRGSILDPPAGSAVAAGNVETSQRLVDVVLGALAAALPGRIPAASQGTMNNVALGGLFPDGSGTFAYYETIAGGHGGRPDGPGMSGRHSHMTNSLNTPVEALEHALPLRVVRYSLRHGSGGAGLHRGGDGVVRELRFLAPVEVTVMSERRRYPPYGLAGGAPGRPGANALRRTDGTCEPLPAKFTRRFAAGEGLILETPGGGGWGSHDEG